MKCSNLVEIESPEIAFRKAREFHVGSHIVGSEQPFISQEGPTVKVGMLYPKESSDDEEKKKALISAALVKMEQTGSTHIMAGYLHETTIYGESYYDGPCDAIF